MPCEDWTYSWMWSDAAFVEGWLEQTTQSMQRWGWMSMRNEELNEWNENKDWRNCSCHSRLFILFVCKTSPFEWVVNQWEVLRSFGATDMKGDRWWERRCRCRQGSTRWLLEWREWMRFQDSSVDHVAYEVSQGVGSCHHQLSHSTHPYQIQASRGVLQVWRSTSFLVGSVEGTSSVRDLLLGRLSEWHQTWHSHWDWYHTSCDRHHSHCGRRHCSLPFPCGRRLPSHCPIPYHCFPPMRQRDHCAGTSDRRSLRHREVRCNPEETSSSTVGFKDTSIS